MIDFDCLFRNANEETKGMCLPMYLRGKARISYDTLVPLEKRHNYEIVKAMLMRLFGRSASDRNRAISDLTQRHQLPNENAIDYVLSMLQLWRKSGYDPNEETDILPELIIANLQPVVKRFFSSGKWTVDKIIDHLLNLRELDNTSLVNLTLTRKSIESESTATTDHTTYVKWKCTECNFTANGRQGLRRHYHSYHL